MVGNADHHLDPLAKLVVHATGLRGQGLEADTTAAIVDADGVLDRPGRDVVVAGRDELRAEDLRSSFSHPHAIEQARVMRRIGVAAVHCYLEVLERAALKVDVAELSHEPRGAFTVFSDEATPGPNLVVVEHGPQAVGGRGITRVLRQREQLGAKGLVAGHHRRE
jgi:hypothetical protein